MEFVGRVEDDGDLDRPDDVVGGHVRGEFVAEFVERVGVARVEYDVDRVIERVEETGLPPRMGARLLDGS
jgi:hypothetical protein